MDIDETVLDNSQYEKSNVLSCSSYSPQSNYAFMEQKTFCANCKVHCYKPVMREKIRAVMRFSGPRMLLHHPVWAIRHVVESKSEKKKLEGQT